MDISILLALQDFRNAGGEVLIDFAKKMTFFGEMNTAVVILALIYWSVSKKLGTYLLLGWSFNRFANGFLKITACTYRPWIRDAAIMPQADTLKTATGYSFPSGHTTNASTIFGGLAVRKDMGKLLRILAFIALLLVGFSRMFLGAHTPQDVLVAMVVCLTIMFFSFKLMNWIEKNPEKDLWVLVWGLAFAIALGIYAAVKPYPMDFNAEGQLIVDGMKMAKDTFDAVGYCSAFFIGWVLERRFINFKTDGVSIQWRLTRVIGGFLGFYVITLIAKPAIASVLAAPVAAIVSSFLMLFYVVFLFPLIINLVENRKVKNEEATVVEAA